MKIGIIKILLCLLPLVNSFGLCNAQSKVSFKKREVVGKYQVGREVMYLANDDLFYLKRTAPRNDVLISECVDTIAKGKWKLLENNIVLLENFSDFNQVVFSIEQTKKLSEDSVYINIVLPNDESSLTGRFEFDMFFSDGIGNYRSAQHYIVLSKDKVSRGATCRFTLTIKDGFPKCNPGTKCYQRTYFNVFENLRTELSRNYLFITLPNFSECFVEQMDINNELMLYNVSKSIFWRGKEYRKVVE